MKFYSLALALPFALAAAHEASHDSANQMPLGYHKYPIQAFYPGDNEGSYMFYILNTHLQFISLNSHCGLYIFWHYYIRKTTICPMLWARQRRIIRHRFSWCAFRYWDFLPSGSSFWAVWYSSRLSSIDPLWRLQRPARGKPFPQWP